MKGNNALYVLADQALRRFVRYGRVEVKYWNGRVRNYTGRAGLDQPVLRVAVKSPRVVRQALTNISLAFGEGYVDGRIEIAEEQLELLFKLIARNRPATTWRQPFRRHRNHKEAQKGYIEAHYSVGNPYYDLFLGETRMYSCAYFASEGMDLDQAQRRKVKHLLTKLQLRPGMRVLDIGCGWGYLAVTAAKEFGVHVVGITLSDKQLEAARELARRENVSSLVEFKGENYLDLKGENEFDRIISVGMFEHVGKDNQDDFFATVARLLVPGGIMVLHSITQRVSRDIDPWTDRYIFPGGHLPTVAEVEEGMARHGLRSPDREDLWWHYAETLRIWRESHQAHRDEIVAMFDKMFYDVHILWLYGSEVGFRDGELGLNQWIASNGKPADGTWPRTREYLYN